jgi:SAM-dependent methyltransferase
MKISETVEELLCDFARIVAAKPAGLHEEFYRFFGYLKKREAALKKVAHLQDIFELSRIGINGARILDAGCGYGVTGLIFAALGARSVHGLELVSHRVEVFKEVKRSLRSDYPVEVQVCDMAIHGIPLESGSADIVIANQAISHFRDQKLFFSEAARVLRPGGELLIADENNGSNRRIARMREDFWEAMEKGPAAPGHEGEIAVEQQRANAIAGKFPSLRHDEVAELARRTSGLWGDTLYAEVREYVESGQLPDRVYRRGTCPVDIDGKNVEFIFKPRQLAADLARYGFRAQGLAHFGGTRGRTVKLANSILRSFSPLTLRYAPAFRVVARRVL